MGVPKRTDWGSLSKGPLDECPFPNARLAFRKGTLDSTNIPPTADHGHRDRQPASSPKVRSARSYDGTDEKQLAPSAPRVWSGSHHPPDAGPAFL